MQHIWWLFLFHYNELTITPTFYQLFVCVWLLLNIHPPPVLLFSFFSSPLLPLRQLSHFCFLSILSLPVTVFCSCFSFSFLLLFFSLLCSYTMFLPSLLFPVHASVCLLCLCSFTFSFLFLHLLTSHILTISSPYLSSFLSCLFHLIFCRFFFGCPLFCSKTLLVISSLYIFPLSFFSFPVAVLMLSVHLHVSISFVNRNVSLQETI